MSGFSAYDIAKLHDDREDLDDTHCPHGESWGDPCSQCGDECEEENVGRGEDE